MPEFPRSASSRAPRCTGTGRPVDAGSVADGLHRPTGQGLGPRRRGPARSRCRGPGGAAAGRGRSGRSCMDLERVGRSRRSCQRRLIGPRLSQRYRQFGWDMIRRRNARCSTIAVGLVPGAAAEICIAGDERYGFRRPRGESAARRREVHRSTHAPASACLPTPPSASRCAAGGSVRIGPLHPNSRSYEPGSASSGRTAAPHGHWLRNEEAVGSDPITSITRTAF